MLCHKRLLARPHTIVKSTPVGRINEKAAGSVQTCCCLLWVENQGLSQIGRPAGPIALLTKQDNTKFHTAQHQNQD